MKQSVVWKITLNDGTIISEFDKNNKETNFQDIYELKEKMVYISLLDLKRGNNCGINLKTGECLINGIPFSVGYNIDGIVYDITNKQFDYANGIIQYKCAKPIPMGINATAIPDSFNIGYKIKIDGFKNSGNVEMRELCYFQVIISINADSGKISICNNKTIKLTDKYGNEKIIKC